MTGVPDVSASTRPSTKARRVPSCASGSHLFHPPQSPPLPFSPAADSRAPVRVLDPPQPSPGGNDPIVWPPAARILAPTAYLDAISDRCRGDWRLGRVHLAGAALCKIQFSFMGFAFHWVSPSLHACQVFSRKAVLLRFLPFCLVLRKYPPGTYGSIGTYFQWVICTETLPRYSKAKMDV